MKTRTYQGQYGNVTVEVCTKREFAQLAAEFVENAEWCEDAGVPNEDTLWIGYQDGSMFSYSDAIGFDGKFRKTGIKFGVITNAATQQVCGRFTVDECGVVQEREA